MSETLVPLDPSTLPVQQRALDQPSLIEIAKVLENGLKSTFQEVTVKVAPCPDLTEAPFDLATRGICGNARLVDVGGPPNLCPLADKTKLYDMRDYPSLAEVGSKEQLVIGPGACPYTFFQRNGEMIANLTVREDKTVGTQKTRVARTYDEDLSHKVFELPKTESKNSLLGNFMISEGREGEVLDISCKKRIGPDNFVTAMRKVLFEAYPDKFLGLGGTFVVMTGKIKIHVMPDFSECPLDSDEKVNNWLKFYEAQTPFPCVSVFYNRDPGMDLRIEHSHGYNFVGEGGHYHYDITPDEVEYRGIYTLGEKCYRIDRPKETHGLGRD